MTKRIEYIDAMRGFTIILVVYSHILTFGFGIYNSEYTSSFNSLLILFRMPLFFFISGFIFYKDNLFQSSQEIISFLKKKFAIQIVPTFIFMVLFAYLMGKDLLEGFTQDSYKLGYWFTLSLFDYFLFYLLLFCIDKFFHKRLLTSNTGLLLTGMTIRLLCSYSFLHLIGIEDYIVNLLSINQMKYFIFFSFGIVIKRNFKDFERIIDKSIALTIIIPIFFILSFIFIKNNRFSNIWIEHFFLIILGILGIVMIFSFFRNYRKYLQRDSSLGKSLQYIGRRTLDIYLIHYFFIPQNLAGESIKSFITKNPTIEFILSISLAILVIILCLIISWVIRTSPYLAHLLFGAKYNQVESHQLSNNNKPN